jgi:uncharacterized protein YdhG (YjbR/CyaY superfamily)
LKILFKTVDEYINSFPRHVQEPLEQIRKTIKQAAPDAQELISYNMPSCKIHKRQLLYYAAHKNHIGFYPMKSAIEKFKNELSIYKGAKGSVQFPLDKPIPLDLITAMVKFRVEENEIILNMRKRKS